MKRTNPGSMTGPDQRRLEQKRARNKRRKQRISEGVDRRLKKIVTYLGALESEKQQMTATINLLQEQLAHATGSNEARSGKDSAASTKSNSTDANS